MNLNYIKSQKENSHAIVRMKNEISKDTEIEFFKNLIYKEMEKLNLKMTVSEKYKFMLAIETAHTNLLLSKDGE